MLQIPSATSAHQGLVEHVHHIDSLTDTRLPAVDEGTWPTGDEETVDVEGMDDATISGWNLGLYAMHWDEPTTSPQTAAEAYADTIHACLSDCLD
jgi:hypothetical protein